jgi:hypothetical protein
MTLHDADQCSHSRAIVGLDAFYCPQCRAAIAVSTKGYALLLHGAANQSPQEKGPPLPPQQRTQKQSKKRPEQRMEKQLVLMF